MVFVLTCCADVYELHSLNVIIDLCREIACPEGLVIVAATTTEEELGGLYCNSEESVKLEM